MSTKHTQGPWKLLPEEVDKPYIRIRGTRLGGRYKIANVVTPDYEGVHPREAEETRANAYLIAAAPELLEALVDVMFRHVPFSDKSDYAEKARAVIAKATGEQA